MVHSCSDGFDEEIEWLFQLKENEEIEIMFQWFQVQCKMGKLHETCKTMRKQMNTKKHESNGKNA
jgi:SET domain-containing protein